MPLSHRTERIAEQIREDLSQMLATEVSDPGVGLVTITRVKVTADLSLARVYWTIIGDAPERAKTAKALGRTVPYLRHLLATRMTLRRVPELKFHFDESVAAQDRIERIIQELHREEAARTDLHTSATVESPASSSEAPQASTSDRDPHAGAVDDPPKPKDPEGGPAASASARPITRELRRDLAEAASGREGGPDAPDAPVRGDDRS